MNRRTSTQAGTPRQRGFTLIEIMIAVVIVAILAAIALPSFLDSVRKSRRSEAFAALSALQQAQERWRGNTAEYATDAQLTLPPRPADPADPAGLGISRATPNSYYTLLLSGTSAAGYTASATAQGNQANDGTCQVLTVEVAGGNIRYGSGAPPDFGDPGRCWAR